tara:strand:- start:66 stop:407 length:342 start_codon:yes stop_codon:yes gene_type:complete
MSTQTYAIIKNRKLDKETNSYLATVICPACGDRRRMALGGWSAIICQGCGVELHKRGRGRPAGAAEDRRTQKVLVRFTEDEKAQAVELAQERGLALAEYLRIKGIGQRLPPKV